MNEITFKKDGKYLDIYFGLITIIAEARANKLESIKAAKEKLSTIERLATMAFEALTTGGGEA